MVQFAIIHAQLKKPNQTVMNMGKKFYLENNASAFCHELVSKANNEWQENDSIVDDITAVIAFF